MDRFNQLWDRKGWSQSLCNWINKCLRPPNFSSGVPFFGTVTPWGRPCTPLYSWKVVSSSFSKISPLSHLANFSHLELSLSGPQYGWPCWITDDLIPFPYHLCMQTILHPSLFLSLPLWLICQFSIFSFHSPPRCLLQAASVFPSRPSSQPLNLPHRGSYFSLQISTNGLNNT